MVCAYYRSLNCKFSEEMTSVTKLHDLRELASPHSLLMASLSTVQYILIPMYRYFQVLIITIII